VSGRAEAARDIQQQIDALVSENALLHEQLGKATARLADAAAASRVTAAAVTTDADRARFQVGRLWVAVCPRALHVEMSADRIHVHLQPCVASRSPRWGSRLQGSGLNYGRDAVWGVRGGRGICSRSLHCRLSLTHRAQYSACRPTSTTGVRLHCLRRCQIAGSGPAAAVTTMGERGSVGYCHRQQPHPCPPAARPPTACPRVACSPAACPPTGAARVAGV
jgi:hypothetical protein